MDKECYYCGSLAFTKEEDVLLCKWCVDNYHSKEHLKSRRERSERNYESIKRTEEFCNNFKENVKKVGKFYKDHKAEIDTGIRIVTCMSSVFGISGGIFTFFNLLN